MGNKACRNAFCYGRKLLPCAGIALLLWGCVPKAPAESHTWATGGVPFKAYNVIYRDTIYQVLDGFVSLPKRDCLTGKKETDIIAIDSLAFEELKEGIVHPQEHMELLLLKDTQTLLGTFFNEHQDLDEESLSEEEEKFLVYALVCRGVTICKDCESGYLYYVQDSGKGGR